MKCKICCNFRTEERRGLAEHVLGVHADYFEDRPEVRELWEKDLEWSKTVERFT